MAEPSRKPIIDRVAALVAGPFLLGKQALSFTWADAQGSPPEPPSKTSARITVTPPEHAIKRRG
jgi:hypothetical protein